MSFPKYPAYKDSGVEWLGQVPQHWEVTRLKNIASIRVSTVDKHVLDDELPVSVCHYVQVYYNRRITSTVTFVKGSAKRDEVAEFTLRRNDVVITKDSETPDDIAVATLVVEDIPNLVCGYHLAILRPHPEELDGRFLYYLQESRPLRAYYTVTARGVTRYGLPYDGIASSPMLLPPLPEQRAIAAFLDAETARIDALVAKQQALITTLQEKRRALISHVVTKGLDASAPMKDSGVPWLGAVPAHWEVLHLRRVLKSMDYGISESLSADEGIAILRMGDVREGELRLDKVGFVEQVEPELLLLPGDLLFNRTNSLDQVGKVGLYRGGAPFPLSFASYLVRLRCKSLLLPEYLNFILNAPGSLAWARGEALPSIGQANLNPNRYSYLPIPLPPFDEQATILAHLHRELFQINTLIAKAQAFIVLSREHRTALIAAAVTGQIDVRGYRMEARP